MTDQRRRGVEKSDQKVLNLEDMKKLFDSMMNAGIPPPPFRTVVDTNDWITLGDLYQLELDGLQEQLKVAQESINMLEKQLDIAVEALEKIIEGAEIDWEATSLAYAREALKKIRGEE